MQKWTWAVVALAALTAIPHAVAQEGSGQQSSICVEDFDPEVDYFADKVESDHSQFWEASYHGNYKVLTVADTENPSGGSLSYVLVQCGTPAPELTGDLEGALLVEVPIERAVVTHRNALAMIDEIGQVPTIVGLTRNYLGYAEGDAWYSELVAAAGSPVDVGSESDLDFETTLALEPDVIFMAGYGPGYNEVTTVSERGLPAIMVSNRTEPTPLGSSEWLKFIAAFYNEEAQANAVFETISTDYTAIAQEVAGRLDDYEVGYACLGEEGGCGFMFAHGDNTLNGQILQLMGVKNPFAEGNDRPNGMDFDYEAALGRVQDTDFFIIYYVASPEALASDPRYQNVPALASGNYIISTVDNYHECNAVTYVRVDRLIRDYAIGMLPELFPGEEGVCFKAPSQ
ncbi:ABC transporter substrate-binding protein [Pelagibacterium sp. H642]|uniref:ABC transporter substrate-binding protein n=1 Tax=Pelagibacterium sp. H642 TaxID=1881069 RepID=UPI002814E903|nr:ABC transporter substrate-binding protein [Pelagibacterium sp. H642]WMT91011.1 ABC transporter substrate-binding protein [Pelagibacterium sp. H642]